MGKSKKIILIALCSVILLGGGIFAGVNWNNWFGKDLSVAEVDENAETWTGDKSTYTGEKNIDTIDIPGTDVINLKADTSEQSVNFYNPEKNSCYFKISLLLSDGTLLWKSKLIEPGKAIYTITLSQLLQAGQYDNAVMKYECFTMDQEQTPLNGSEIKMTLNVID